MVDYCVDLHCDCEDQVAHGPPVKAVCDGLVLGRDEGALLMRELFVQVPSIRNFLEAERHVVDDLSEFTITMHVILQVNLKNQNLVLIVDPVALW